MGGWSFFWIIFSFELGALPQHTCLCLNCVTIEFFWRIPWKLHLKLLLDLKHISHYMLAPVFWNQGWVKVVFDSFCIFFHHHIFFLFYHIYHIFFDQIFFHQRVFGMGSKKKGPGTFIKEVASERPGKKTKLSKQLIHVQNFVIVKNLFTFGQLFRPKPQNPYESHGKLEYSWVSYYHCPLQLGTAEDWDAMVAQNTVSTQC